MTFEKKLNYLIMKELKKSTIGTVRHFVDESMECNPAKKCESVFNLFHEAGPVRRAKNQLDLQANVTMSHVTMLR